MRHSRILALGLLLAGMLTLGCSVTSSSSSEPLVETTSGIIAGDFHAGVFSFKGIPYAQAERFMPPQPPAAWEGVRQHTEFGPIAMQVNSWSPEEAMNEHELFTVNVWTQGLDDGKKRPVMFWLHGGGFWVGASDDPITDGQWLAENGDVVLVSVNHRLNILGFLDLSVFGERYADSGNVGMLDVVAALEWVQNNIERFGGDPNNVTIFGESGGGGKVGTVLSMPGAEGLFHKAIIQSGTLVNEMTQEISQTVGRALVENLGGGENALEKLRTMPYKELVEVGDQALAQTVGLRTPGSRRVVGFAPVPDGVNLLQQPFTPGFAPMSDHIPLLIGTTLNEMMPTAYAEKQLTREEAKTRLAETYGAEIDTFVTLYEQAYEDATPQDLLSIDTIFRSTTIEVADARAAATDAPLYVYMLTWKSPVDDHTRGSFHGLDIPLAFHNLELGKHWTGTGAEAETVAKQMSAAWLNFARTGDPNATEVLPIWQPYTQENGETMIFDVPPRVVNHHDRELMELIKAHF